MISRQIPVDLYQNPFHHEQQQQQEQPSSPSLSNHHGHGMFNRGSRHQQSKQNGRRSHYPSSGGGMMMNHATSSSNIRNSYFSSYYVMPPWQYHYGINSKRGKKQQLPLPPQSRSSSYLCVVLRIMMTSLWLVIVMFAIVNVSWHYHHNIMILDDNHSSKNVTHESSIVINTTFTDSSNPYVYGRSNPTINAIDSVVGNDSSSSSSSSRVDAITVLFDSPVNENGTIRTLERQEPQQQPEVDSWRTTTTDLFTVPNNTNGTTTTTGFHEYAAVAPPPTGLSSIPNVPMGIGSYSHSTIGLVNSLPLTKSEPIDMVTSNSMIGMVMENSTLAVNAKEDQMVTGISLPSISVADNQRISTQQQQESLPQEVLQKPDLSNQQPPQSQSGQDQQVQPLYVSSDTTSQYDPPQRQMPQQPYGYGQQQIGPLPVEQQHELQSLPQQQFPMEQQRSYPSDPQPPQQQQQTGLSSQSEQQQQQPALPQPYNFNNNPMQYSYQQPRMTSLQQDTNQRTPEYPEVLPGSQNGYQANYADYGSNVQPQLPQAAYPLQQPLPLQQQGQQQEQNQPFAQQQQPQMQQNSLYYSYHRLPQQGQNPQEYQPPLPQFATTGSQWEGQPMQLPRLSYPKMQQQSSQQQSFMSSPESWQQQQQQYPNVPEQQQYGTDRRIPNDSNHHQNWFQNFMGHRNRQEPPPYPYSRDVASSSLSSSSLNVPAMQNIRRYDQWNDIHGSLHNHYGSSSTVKRVLRSPMNSDIMMDQSQYNNVMGSSHLPSPKEHSMVPPSSMSQHHPLESTDIAMKNAVTDQISSTRPWTMEIPLQQQQREQTTAMNDNTLTIHQATTGQNDHGVVSPITNNWSDENSNTDVVRNNIFPIIDSTSITNSASSQIDIPASSNQDTRASDATAAAASSNNNNNGGISLEAIPLPQEQDRLEAFRAPLLRGSQIQRIVESVNNDASTSTAEGTNPKTVKNILSSLFWNRFIPKDSNITS